MVRNAANEGVYVLLILVQKGSRAMRTAGQLNQTQHHGASRFILDANDARRVGDATGIIQMRRRWISFVLLGRSRTKYKVEGRLSTARVGVANLG
jgi:hypothetical protein